MYKPERERRAQKQFYYNNMIGKQDTGGGPLIFVLKAGNLGPSRKKNHINNLEYLA